MHHVDDDHDGQRAVQRTQRVVGVVEKQDVAHAQHQPRHAHGQRCHRLDGRAQRRVGMPGFFHEVRGHKYERGAQRGCQQRHPQAVQVGVAHTRIGQTVGVVAQRGGQVVGPEGDERGVYRHAQHGQHGGGHHGSEQQQQAVAGHIAFGLVGHGASRHAGLLAALHPAVHHIGQHHRHQQHQRHHGPVAQVLLAHRLHVNLNRQHLEVAADDLGNAELADRIGKHQHARADQPVLGRRQGHGHKFAPARCTQGIGGFKQAAIRRGQRHDQHHQRMRKAGKHRGHDDAQRPIHRGVAQPGLEHALRAKPLNERNGPHQRRPQQRRQAQHAPQAFEWHARPLNGIGIQKSQRHRDGCDHQGHPKSVPRRIGHAGRGQHVFEPLQAPVACIVHHAVAEQCAHGQQQKDHQHQCGKHQQPAAGVEAAAQRR